jgi:uncharacterized protein
MRRAGLFALAVVIATAIVVPSSRVRAETPIPPPPEHWVTDRAGFLTPPAAADIDERLADYNHRTGHQVLVYIDHTSGGVPIEDWSVRAFERWRVGRRGIDDGLLLLVFADDHRVRFEVGYGLEDRVPDAVAKRIIDEQITPRIRAGERDAAIRAGIVAVVAAIGGAAGPASGVAEQPAPAPVPVWKLIVGGVFLLFLIGFVVTHPSLAWLMLLSIGSGRGGGGGFGGGGGGGGFSGGGGRSGGGGASGSW